MFLDLLTADEYLYQDQGGVGSDYRLSWKLVGVFTPPGNQPNP